jgi:hypothetical protein
MTKLDGSPSSQEGALAGRTLGCIQPSYIPWRGYFEIIARSDVFVFYDDVAYTKQDWRNRNRIKTNQGAIWLTIPVQKQTTDGRICDVLIDNTKNWSRKHWRSICEAYSKAPYFRKYEQFFGDAFEREWTHLSDFCIYLATQICEWLEIKAELVRSSKLGLSGVKTDRLVQLCEKLEARHYLSGPSAQDYIELDKFAAINVGVEYMHYDYSEYPQLHGDFRGDVSIIDLLFNCGEQSSAHLGHKSRRTSLT